MPTLYMMVGVPGSGKSTWINSQDFDYKSTIILSTDNYIDKIAMLTDSTYSSVYHSEIKNADKNLKESLALAIKNGYDIVWDQTNPSVKVRRKKLNKIPAHYKKVAVCIPLLDKEELMKRIRSRKHKYISSTLLTSMIDSFTIPTLDEGFDEVIIL